MEMNEKRQKLSFREKRQKKFEEKRAKEQKKDLERYGLTPFDMKDKSASSSEEVKRGYPSLRKCLKYFKNYKWYLIGVLICALIYVGLATFTPIFTEKLIDALGLAEYGDAVKFAVFIVVFEVVLQAIFYFWNVLAEVSFTKVIRKLRLDLFNAVSNTKSTKFDQINSGTIVSRINTDTVNISDVVLVIIGCMSDVFVGVGFIIYAFFINVWVALLMVVSIILVATFGNLYQRYNYKVQKKKKVLTDKRVGFTSEFVRGIRDVKNLNIRNSVKTKFLENVDNTARISIDKSVYGGMLNRGRWMLMAITEFLCTILGIYLLTINQISIGGLLIFIMYSYRARNMFQSMQQIREGIRNASVSAERVYEILDDNIYPKETFGTKEIKNPKGEIEFKKVCFSYDKNTKVFDNLSLVIEANKSVAFVGKSGQGKSTLLSLIPKLYELDKGKITIDKVDITKLSEDGLRELVTVVPQNPYIFNTSIRENLKFIKPDLTDEEMFEVCKQAQIHDFIMTKENGYDSLLGENGLILSGGQKQRLAIARALLKKSKIILLDEATSALDNENQSKIQAVIEDLTKDHTVIIVAHRLSTVVNCDKIFMLENGNIIGEGEHNELMQNCAAYKNLYKVEQKAAKLEEA